MKQGWIITGAVMLSAVLTPTLRAETGLNIDIWHILMFGDERAGYAHEVVTDDGEHIRTRVDMKITVRRGNMTINMKAVSEFLETSEGEAIEAVTTTLLGQLEVKQTMRFKEDGVELVTQQGASTNTQTFPPIEGEWQTPGEVHRMYEKVMEQNTQEFTIRSIEPTVGPEPMEMTLKRVGEENVEVIGKVVPATVWEVHYAALPNATMMTYVDAQGNPVKQTVSLMPGMELTMLLADEALATAEVNPPELMADTLVKPAARSRPIADARALRSAVYEVTLAPELKPDVLDLPKAGVQHVVWGDDRTVRVIVDLDQPVPPGTDLPGDEHLAASTALRHSDPVINELVERALGNNADQLGDADKADKLRQFVREFIEEKDLSVGFATASEVARTAQGDCTEHAVLLAALLRAAGIPSRTVTGLIYVDEFLGQRDIFGYHMWAQAFLDDGSGGRWVDLDATLPGEAFDAGHIALGHSTMADDTLINNLVALAPLLGSLEIRIVEVNGAAAAPTP